jgi:hypothetical protein
MVIIRNIRQKVSGRVTYADRRSTDLPWRRETHHGSESWTTFPFSLLCIDVGGNPQYSERDCNKHYHSGNRLQGWPLGE